MILTTLEEIAALQDTVWNLSGVTVGTLDTTINYRYVLSFGTAVLTATTCTIPMTVANDSALHFGELFAELPEGMDLIIDSILSGIEQNIFQIDSDGSTLQFIYQPKLIEKYTLNV